MTRHPSIACALLLALAVSFTSNVHAESFRDVLKGIITEDKKKEEGASTGGDHNDSAKSIVNTLTSSQTQDEEIKVGEGVAATVLGAAPIWNDAKAQRYINLVGRLVADQSERNRLPWSFAVIDTASINAFAAPGGIILVTRGLYALLETEDELAAILAHEIAHVTRQHHYKVIKKQKTMELGATLLKQRQGSNNEVTSKLVNVGAELMARGLDKSAEFEADRDAMVLAARAGYDSSAIISVLDKLAARSASDASLQLLFQTHPSPSERIKELSAAVNTKIEAAAVSSSAANRMKRAGK